MYSTKLLLSCHRPRCFYGFHTSLQIPLQVSDLKSDMDDYLGSLKEGLVKSLENLLTGTQRMRKSRRLKVCVRGISFIFLFLWETSTQNTPIKYC